MSTLIWPADLRPNEQQFHLLFTTRQFKSPFTGNAQTMEFPAVGWTCRLNLKRLNKDQVRMLELFLIQLRGAAGRFRIGDQYHKNRGLAEGAPQINGANQVGARLDITGCKPNQNFLLAGDYITVNNEYKRLISDANADENGNTALHFEPNLRRSPSDGSAVVVDRPYCIMRLADDKQGQVKRMPRSGSVTLNLVEDIYQ